MSNDKNIVELRLNWILERQQSDINKIRKKSFVLICGSSNSNCAGVITDITKEEAMFVINTLALLRDSNKYDISVFYCKVMRVKSWNSETSERYKIVPLSNGNILVDVKACFYK